MNLAHALSTYLTLNLLIALSYIGLNFTLKKTRPSSALKSNYATLTLILALSAAHPLIPRRQFFEPPAKVWSAQSMRSFSQDHLKSDGYLALPSRHGTTMLKATQVSSALSLLFLAAILFGSLRIGRDLLALRKIRKQSFQIKRIKSVLILAHDQIQVPFSYWTPWRTHVILPSALMSKPLDYQIAIAHELQHHRQSDTKWVYVILALKTLCALNPFIYLWNRWLLELQEFACDETLVDRKKVSSRQYARCLIEVAETALNHELRPACATGLAFLVERNLLKRRIEKMMTSSYSQITRSIRYSVAALMIALITATAFASQSIIQDRRVTLADAQKMAANAKSGSGVPIVVNDLVLNELNRYIGTPEGREFIRSSLQRMENYRPLVESKLNAYQVPMEFLALPIIESGYQDLVQSHAPRSAGIWQFIPQTARNYGLRVDEQVDERRNAELLTDAAMRYLKSNHLRFNDWLLATFAYNAGETKVQEGISKTGSRDPWVLVREGYENDSRYLAKFVAAVLIMKNPDSVAQ